MNPLIKTKIKSATPLAKALQGLALGAACFAVAAVMFLGKIGTDIESKTWDLRVQTLAKPSAATGQIAVIALDQKSLDWGKTENAWSWPWPREIYASILKFLERAQAKVVAYDVFFTEPSSYGVEDDQALAHSIVEFKHFAAAAFMSNKKTDRPTPWPPNSPEVKLSVQNLAPSMQAKDASFPIPEISRSAAILANTTSWPDSDGIYRRSGLIWSYQGKSVPSLAVAAYLLGNPGKEFSIDGSNLRVDGSPFRLDEEGAALLNFRGPSATHPQYTVAQVLRSEFNLESDSPAQTDSEGKPFLDPSVFRDKYVFFGFTALGLYDLRPIPLEANYPGVEVHATVLDNLLNKDFMTKTPFWFDLVYSALLLLACGTLIRMCRNARQTLATFIVFLMIPIFASFAAYPLGYWLALVVPEMLLLVCLLSGLVINYAGEGRQKKFIKDAFSQYLSPVVIERLVQNPDLLVLGGEKRDLSILFSDVRGFTSISETLDPVQLTALLNDYLSEVTSVIYQYGGTIDKYEGDAVIAFWNAPLDLSDHAQKAVRAALEYQKRLSEIRPRLKEMSGGHEVVARIGINTGPVVIGNMGSNQRFNYTFFGDAGNLASRLEGMNKQFGTFFMVSKNTKDAAGDAPDIYYRELSRVAVVGKSEPVTVFEPMFLEQAQAKADVLKHFEQGLQLYYSGDFLAARAKMKEIADVDPPAASYVKKLNELIESPPTAWNGVWLATEK